MSKLHGLDMGVTYILNVYEIWVSYLAEALEHASAGEVLELCGKKTIDLHQFYNRLICNGV